MSPDERAELEAERDFLLRSLEDLASERAVGDVDDADYTRLADSYTARAADVIRRLESGSDHPVVDDPAERTPAPSATGEVRRRRGVVAASIIGVLAIAVLSGILVAQSTGERLPGQVASGNVESDSVSGLLARARSLLDPNDPRAALDLYGDVLAIEPDNAEALTYLGWLSALSARTTVDDDEAVRLVRSGVLLLRQATTVDDQYADPHCFLGIIFSRFIGDDEAALASFDQCLALDPPSDTRQLVEPIVAELRGETPTPTAG
jgi:tetratricopeptide (TPR) repeat protein